MMKRYRIEVIGEGDLPEGHGWAFLCDRDAVVLVVKESAVGDVRTWSDVWAAYRQMLAGDLLTTVTVPTRPVLAAAI